MKFKDYIKNNHHDPDTLLGKPLYNGMDELIMFYRQYLITCIESAKMKPEYADVVWNFNMGLDAAINKIKES